MSEVTLSQLEQYLSKAAWILKDARHACQDAEAHLKAKLKEFGVSVGPMPC